MYSFMRKVNLRELQGEQAFAVSDKWRNDSKLEIEAVGVIILIHMQSNLKVQNSLGLFARFLISCGIALRRLYQVGSF